MPVISLLHMDCACACVCVCVRHCGTQPADSPAFVLQVEGTSIHAETGATRKLNYNIE